MEKKDYCRHTFNRIEKIAHNRKPRRIISFQFGNVRDFDRAPLRFISTPF